MFSISLRNESAKTCLLEEACERRVSGLEPRITTTYYALESTCARTGAVLAAFWRRPIDRHPAKCRLPCVVRLREELEPVRAPVLEFLFGQGLFWEKNVDQTPLVYPSKSPIADRVIHDVNNDDPY